MSRVVFFMLLFLMVGCSSKYKQENYQKFQQETIQENWKDFEAYRKWYIHDNKNNEKEMESVEDFQKSGL